MSTRQPDPSIAAVELYDLNRGNEELLAYMDPTPKQRKQIQENCVRIAHLALKIHDYYKQNS